MFFGYFLSLDNFLSSPLFGQSRDRYHLSSLSDRLSTAVELDSCGCFGFHIQFEQTKVIALHKLDQNDSPA